MKQTPFRINYTLLERVIEARNKILFYSNQDINNRISKTSTKTINAQEINKVGLPKMGLNDNIFAV